MRLLPDLFKALSDPTRLRILRLLDGVELQRQRAGRPSSRQPQPTVSRHLAGLLRAGFAHPPPRRHVDILNGWNASADALAGNGLGTGAAGAVARVTGR
jgi:hypothetical protein